MLACVNTDNDLISLIDEYGVGLGCSHEDISRLESMAVDLIKQISDGKRFDKNCEKILKEKFSVEQCVDQITRSL